jgi:hypothetical protein
MRFLHSIVVACVLAMALASIVSGQQERPASIDDLLAEMRALRADTNRAAENTVRAQLVTARLMLQEGRLATLSQRLSIVRQQIADSQLTLAPFTLQIKQAQESNSEILAPLRATRRASAEAGPRTARAGGRARSAGLLRRAALGRLQRATGPAREDVDDPTSMRGTHVSGFCSSTV